MKEPIPTYNHGSQKFGKTQVTGNKMAPVF